MPGIVYILNGPNLNLLGVREPSIYGTTTLKQIEQACKRYGKQLGVTVEFRQTNHEGVMIDWIQEARSRAAGIIINPAGFTSTSIAVLDALLASDLPIVEVHLSNIHRREEFRHHSFVSKAATGVICGFGARGYRLALDGIAEHLAKPAPRKTGKA
jgi:3-dehydroquinate dehydratase-2